MIRFIYKYICIYRPRMVVHLMVRHKNWTCFKFSLMLVRLKFKNNIPRNLAVFFVGQLNLFKITATK